MSQHDQVIDNGSGLTVRTDINAALAALFSSSSGPVEPAVRQAGQFWFDIANAAAPTVRVRNAANTAWVAMITIDNINLGTGKRASPNRWVWNTAADLSGTDVMTLAATGLLTLSLGGITAAGVLTGTQVSSTSGTFVGAGGATMTLTTGGLTLPAGSDLTMDTIRLASTTAASATSTAHAYQAGPSTGVNARMDTGKIYTANNGVAGGLFSFPNGISLGLPLGIAYGGTSATTAAAALAALGGLDAGDAVPPARTVTAGNGLTGGGALSANITLNVGTPTSITPTSTNAVTADGHSHALADVVGIGQSWSAQTRTANTSYQNTTGSAIMVAVWGQDGGTLQASSNGTTWINISQFGGSDRSFGSMIIPINHYYRCTAAGWTYWSELR